MLFSELTASLALTVKICSYVLLIYVLGKILVQVVWYRYCHPLMKFPGPFLASITRLWITYHNVKADELDVCASLHKKYGPIIRITPTMLLVSDARKLPEIYHRNADKSRFYITGSFGATESMFNMQDHRVHATRRRIAAGPYSLSNVRRMEPLMDATIAAWLSQLDSKFASSSDGPEKDAFDFSSWAVYMAYDVISEVGFGARIGFIEKGIDVAGLIQGFHDGLVPFGIMARLYPFTEWVKSTWFGRYLVASPDQQSGIGAIMRFRDVLIQKRFEDLEKGKESSRFDLLQCFIDARDDEGSPMPLDCIKAETLLVLMAGADTTGTAFQALVTHLLAHPRSMARMMSEIETATRAGRLSSPIPGFDEVIRNCPFYIACIRESMRLSPPAPNMFPRLVDPGGMTLGGQYVPEGCEVACNPWLVHRDRSVYGDDAEEFCPERWLDETAARDYARYSMAFGYGARVCLGQDIARMELYKAPLAFFRAFHVAVDGNRKGRCIYKGGVSYFEDMWLKIKRRG